jgi:hypothetical protein
MTDKQKLAFDETIAAIPDESREDFKRIAEYAVSLGYMPVSKGKGTYTDFVKSKVKRTIMKIDLNPHPPRLGLKFYALPEYFGVFKKALDERVEVYNRLKYQINPHCIGCMQRRNGRCGKPQGYTLTLPDGKQGFLCGFGVIPLPPFTAGDVPGIIDALRLQDAYFATDR